MTHHSSLSTSASLGHVSFVVVDFETTGFDPTVDRIIQLAAVVVNGENQIQNIFDTIVTPECPSQYTHGAEHIHGISEAQVTQGMPLRAALDALWNITSEAIFTAHNAQFDLGFLHAESARVGINRTITHHVDTLLLARKTDVDRTRKHSLQALCEHYGIVHSQAHEARSDALATTELLFHLMRELDVSSPEQLQDLLA
jgi:DNA polymerase III epsilon subunit-like protein